MGKDGLVVLQGYGYIAPTALPFSCSLCNPRPPLRSDLGLRIWRPVAGLSLTELFDRIADSYPKRSKMTTEGGLEWKAEQEAFLVTKIMDIALQSVV